MGISPRLIAPFLVLTALSGCAITQPHMLFSKTAPAEPAQVVATWSNRVSFVPDPANNGVPAPGIAGRVYLFGPTPDFPMSGNGNMVVDLYDDSPRNGQPSSVHLEQWRFDPATLQQLFKKDTIGMGYTLFLPWGTYRPDIKIVHLAVKYEPLNGTPLYAPIGKVSLEHSPAPAGLGTLTK